MDLILLCTTCMYEAVESGIKQFNLIECVCAYVRACVCVRASTCLPACVYAVRECVCMQVSE